MRQAGPVREQLRERDSSKLRVQQRGFSGKIVPIVDFHESLPASTSVPIMVAVIALVHDPRCIWSLICIG